MFSVSPMITGVGIHQFGTVADRKRAETSHGDRLRLVWTRFGRRYRFTHLLSPTFRPSVRRYRCGLRSSPTKMPVVPSPPVLGRLGEPSGSSWELPPRKLFAFPALECRVLLRKAVILHSRTFIQERAVRQDTLKTPTGPPCTHGMELSYIQGQI